MNKRGKEQERNINIPYEVLNTEHIDTHSHYFHCRDFQWVWWQQRNPWNPYIQQNFKLTNENNMYSTQQQHTASPSSESEKRRKKREKKIIRKVQEICSTEWCITIHNGVWLMILFSVYAMRQTHITIFNPKQSDWKKKKRKKNTTTEQKNVRNLTKFFVYESDRLTLFVWCRCCCCCCCWHSFHLFQKIFTS